MLRSITQPVLFQPSIHQTFHALIAEKSIDRKSATLEQLPMEAKYALIELSSLGVLKFTEDRITVTEGMESWIRLFWCDACLTG